MSIDFGKWRQDNPHCFYRTPRVAVEVLLAHERFTPPIWECACGDGGIGQPLIETYGEDNAICTDLIDYGDPVLHGDKDYTWFQMYATGGVDFLKQQKKVPTIVTNLPFNDDLPKMIEHALSLATEKVVLLMEDRQASRRNIAQFYRNGMLSAILKMQWRLRFGNQAPGGPKCSYGHHWAVWEKGHHGPAIHIPIAKPTDLELHR